MRVHVASRFPCSPDRFWTALVRTDVLAEISAPLIAFEAVEPPDVIERWIDRLLVRVKTSLFGRLPLGVRTIEIVEVDASRGVVRTRERDALVRRWDHEMHVARNGAGTRFTDSVEIDAGLATPLVWLFATQLYKHRHRRWRSVVRRLNGLA